MCWPEVKCYHTQHRLTDATTLFRVNAFDYLSGRFSERFSEEISEGAADLVDTLTRAKANLPVVASSTFPGDTYFADELDLLCCSSHESFVESETLQDCLITIGYHRSRFFQLARLNVWIVLGKRCCTLLLKYLQVVSR